MQIISTVCWSEKFACLTSNNTWAARDTYRQFIIIFALRLNAAWRMVLFSSKSIQIRVNLLASETGLMCPIQRLVVFFLQNWPATEANCSQASRRGCDFGAWKTLFLVVITVVLVAVVVVVVVLCLANLLIQTHLARPFLLHRTRTTTARTQPLRLLFNFELIQILIKRQATQLTVSEVSLLGLRTLSADCHAFGGPNLG